MMACVACNVRGVEEAEGGTSDMRRVEPALRRVPRPVTGVLPPPPSGTADHAPPSQCRRKHTSQTAVSHLPGQVHLSGRARRGGRGTDGLTPPNMLAALAPAKVWTQPPAWVVGRDRVWGLAMASVGGAGQIAGHAVHGDPRQRRAAVRQHPTWWRQGSMAVCGVALGAVYSYVRLPLRLRLQPADRPESAHPSFASPGGCAAQFHRRTGFSSRAGRCADHTRGHEKMVVPVPLAHGEQS